MSDHITTINSIFEQKSLDKNSLLRKINEAMAVLSIGEQLELHCLLSTEALVGLYETIGEIDINSQAKEHITWHYFKQRLLVESSIVGDDFLKDLLSVYEVTRYLALESLIIELLKTFRITNEQLVKIEDNVKSKTFLKESILYKYRSYIVRDNKLTKDEVIELLNLRAYHILDFALESNAVSVEGLNQLILPIVTSADKKRKEGLYNKAKSKLKENF
ncbi:hypothetical protein [Paenibacillus sp. FJAT-26967]|uniref:hypothetical protein n=1 Tax=Paenibacillus sp. FJAT-26967 TaxID=1729690 RepID=UPI0008380D25|nr:hypothetical protein [Paenibacillus sp. FJAT-26967]